jgi:hypothetical protein
MATVTLKTLSEQIAKDDAQIIDTQEQSNEHLKSIDKGIQKFLANQANKKLDDLEAQREKGKTRGLLAGIGAGAAAASSGGKSLKPSTGFGINLPSLLNIGLIGGSLLAAKKAIDGAAKGITKAFNAVKLAFDDTALNQRKVNKLQAQEIERRAKAEEKRLNAERKAAEADARAKANALKKAEAERTRAAYESEKFKRKTGQYNAEMQRQTALAEERAANARAAKIAADEKAANIKVERERVARIQQQARASKSIDALDSKAIARQTEALRFLKQEAQTIKAPAPTPPKLTGSNMFTGKRNYPLPQGYQVGGPTAPIRGKTEVAVRKALSATGVGVKAGAKALRMASTVAAPLLAAADYEAGQIRAVKEARASGQDVTKADVIAGGFGGVAGGIVGLADLLSATMNWVEGGFTKDSFVSSTSFGADTAKAVEKATKQLAKQTSLGQQNLNDLQQRSVTDELSAPEEAARRRAYVSRIAGGQRAPLGGRELAEMEMKRRDAFNSRFTLAPQTNLVDNSSRSNTTVINQQENPVLAVDYWLYKYGTVSKRHIP